MQNYNIVKYFMQVVCYYWYAFIKWTYPIAEHWASMSGSVGEGLSQGPFIVLHNA